MLDNICQRYGIRPAIAMELTIQEMAVFTAGTYYENEQHNKAKSRQSNARAAKG